MKQTVKSAAHMLVDTINATGGCLTYANGYIAPAGEPDWIDLGEAYLIACAEIGQEPQLTPSEGD